MNQLPSFYGKGNVDLRGPRGEPGERGPQGEPGPRGEPGRDGKDATGGASPADLKRLSDDVALLKTSVTDEVTARTDGEEALAGRLQSVEASYAKRTDVDIALDARVSEEATARANAILAEATTRQELAATLRSETTSKVSAAIQVEQKARADEYGAIASRVGAIEADYTTAGEVDTKVTAKVSEEAQARADAVSAVASRVQALEATSGSGGSGEDAVARAAIEEEARVRADAISAEAAARQSLAATLRDETSAAVSSEAKARSDAVAAEAASRQSLAATLRDETSAALTSEAKARSDAVSAEATSRSSLAADLRRQIVGASPALPSDFRLKDTFWRLNFAGSDDRPADFDLAYWAFNGSTAEVRNATNFTGLFDTATLGSVKLIPGRRRRLTVVWRVLYAGGLPDAQANVLFIGLNADRAAVYNPGQDAVITAGAPGWGTTTGWQRASFEVSDDDMIAQGCVYVRGLMRLIGRGTNEHWEIQSIALEDVTSEAAMAARVTSEAEARADAVKAVADRTATLETNTGKLASRVTTAEQALSDGTFATAKSVQTVEARAATRPNLQANGGFESGLAGVQAPAGAVVVDDAASGKRVLHWALDGETLALMPPVNVQAGIRYTVSLDLTLSADSGALRVDPSLWTGYNATGSVTYDTLSGPSWPVGTSSNGPRKEFSFTAPITGSIQLRLIASGISNPRSIDVSRVKVEAGDAPATSYTAEAALAGVVASVKVQSEATADLYGRNKAWFGVTADNGTGRAQLAVFAEGYSAGVDIVGDLHVSGNAVIDGTLTTGKLATGAATTEKIAENAVTYSQSLGGISGTGVSDSFTAESPRMSYTSRGGRIKLDVQSDGRRTSGSGIMQVQLWANYNGGDVALSRLIAFSPSSTAVPVTFYAVQSWPAGTPLQLFLRYYVFDANTSWSYSGGNVFLTEFLR